MQQIEVTDLTLSLRAATRLSLIMVKRDRADRGSASLWLSWLSWRTAHALIAAWKWPRYLERLAAHQPFADIEDPVAWQREVRQDRPAAGPRVKNALLNSTHYHLNASKPDGDKARNFIRRHSPGNIGYQPG